MCDSDDKIEFTGKSFDSVEDMFADIESRLTKWDKFKRATWYPLLYRLERFQYSIKKIYQKIVKGRADEEIWNLDYYIVRYVTPRIVELRDMDRYGYPAELKSDEEWQEILNKIAEAFVLYKMDIDGEESLYKDGNGKYDFSEYRRFNDKIQEGLELFGKYLRYLGD